MEDWNPDLTVEVEVFRTSGGAIACIPSGSDSDIKRYATKIYMSNGHSPPELKQAVLKKLGVAEKPSEIVGDKVFYGECKMVDYLDALAMISGR